MERSAPGDGPVRRQPWLHELVVTTAGNVTALSAADGDIGRTPAEGVFVDDARVVSRLLATLGGRRVQPVGHAALGSESEFVGSARDLGAAGPDPTVELRRLRTVHGGGCRETVSITSRAAEVDAELTLVLGGDGAEIAAVKSGATVGVLGRAVATAGGGHWATGRHTVSVVCDPEPSVAVDPDGALRLTVPLTVGAGATVAVVLEVSVERLAPSLFDATAGGDAVDWPREVTVAAGDPRLGRAVHASLSDLRSLVLRDPADPSDIFVGAGSPWYLTLFGRDSLWSARLALPLGTDLAAGTLRALARRQGTTYDASRSEEPGKILHELRRVGPADRVDPDRPPGLPPVYYGTVDATSLWVCLLHDAWLWGMPEGEVRALLPPLRRASRWLTDVAPGEDGLLRYLDESGHGLVNQGWKDSSDSMRWRDGRVADAPIALIEAQAYAVEAALGAAVLLRELGDPADTDRASELEGFAARLRHVVRQRFWVADDQDRYPAMAVDGHGAAVTGLGSNMGHALGTGTFGADEAARVTALLSEPRMLGAHGITTLATDNGGFNPLGYHTGSVWTHDTAICALGMLREGHRGEAAVVARRLLDAAEAFGYRYPELFADRGVLGAPVPYPASCRPQAWSAASAVALLTVALGLTVDVPRRTVTVRPPPGLPFGPVTVSGLRVGAAVVTVSVDATGAVSVVGLPDGYTLVTSA